MKDRRHFLRSGAKAATALSLSSPWALCSAKQKSIALMSAASSKDDKHFAVFLDASGNIVKSRRIPTRGHSAAFDYRSNRGIFVARRPGRQLFILSPHAESGHRTVVADPARHFYGHAVIVDNGKILLTTENDYQSGRGKIVYRDIKKGYKVVKEIDSHGVGPHELVGLNGLLAVANGGLKTHPASPRKNLNVESMRPNLSIIDWPKRRTCKTV